VPPRTADIAKTNQSHGTRATLSEGSGLSVSQNQTGPNTTGRPDLAAVGSTAGRSMGQKMSAGNSNMRPSGPPRQLQLIDCTSVPLSIQRQLHHGELLL